VVGELSNISIAHSLLNDLARKTAFDLSNLNLATLSGAKAAIFRARQDRIRELARIGRQADATVMWDLLNHMGAICIALRQIGNPRAELLKQGTGFFNS
jgi:hypothetical protein